MTPGHVRRGSGPAAGAEFTSDQSSRGAGTGANSSGFFQAGAGVGRAGRPLRRVRLGSLLDRGGEHGGYGRLQLAPATVPARLVPVEVTLAVPEPISHAVAQLPMQPAGGVAGTGEQHDEHQRDDLVQGLLLGSCHICVTTLCLTDVTTVNVFRTDRKSVV